MSASRIDHTAGTAPAREEPAGPLVLINTFYPKPGMLDLFIEKQIAETQRLGPGARAHGWIGNRIHRSLDGETVVIVTLFGTAAAQAEWAASADFAEHLALIRPLLDRVESRPFSLVSENGAS